MNLLLHTKPSNFVEIVVFPLFNFAPKGIGILLLKVVLSQSRIATPGVILHRLAFFSSHELSGLEILSWWRGKHYPKIHCCMTSRVVSFGCEIKNSANGVRSRV